MRIYDFSDLVKRRDLLPASGRACTPTFFGIDGEPVVVGHHDVFQQRPNSFGAWAPYVAVDKGRDFGGCSLGEHTIFSQVSEHA
jgi:hypothetical protein